MHDLFAVVKAKNVVTLEVDGVFAAPGIGRPGVSSTDTSGGLFIGGHPNPESLPGLGRDVSPFNGCMKDIVIEGKPLGITQNMLSGEIIDCQA